LDFVMLRLLNVDKIKNKKTYSKYLFLFVN